MRFLLSLFLLLAPSMASAHAILLQSQPAAAASVSPGRTEIVLRYNSRIDQGRSRLMLSGTNAQAILPLESGRPPDTLAAAAELTPGDYVVHWQVLAVDGHITRGDVRFSVKPR